MKVFVDTNVLIDYVCKRDPFFIPSKSVFALCFLKKIEIAVSALSIVNTLYIGRNHDSVAIKSCLLGLSQIVKFVDLPAETVLQTLQMDWKDYEDALQNATALQVNADCIVTRNKKDFQLSPLPIYTPEEFMDFFVRLLNTKPGED